ncbi:nucleolar zinc-finger protein [Malassezia cuniculi]|uniref:Nucleolar zinc-finger protein n=1 Tax=Malassezia cuniculi TaxID=948313 RepID=A0AAF0J846_9BASI|nr:nucleolar zinc-finger protein [Malassezia cuniculi]
MSNDPNFRPIGEHVAEDDAKQGLHEIESLCMNCHKQGITRMLPTYIPYFREVIVMSFYCPHCGTRNSEVQSAGEIQDKGVVYTVHIVAESDLNRQVVKSEYCTVSIPDIQLQIPAGRGQITTVEGVLSDTIEDLSLDQPVRKHMQPEVYEKIEALINKLRAIIGRNEGDATTPATGERRFEPFKIVLDDPSGNSFVDFTGGVEHLGASDNKWSKRDYHRTREQNEMLGIGVQVQENAPAGEHIDREEILHFDGNCSSCNAPIRTNVKTVDIPYFKETLIMSTVCDNCGFRDNEVKSGAAISDKGRKLTLRVEDVEDLSRDVLKSESAGMTIPEIDLHLSPGTLGGRFTTLEGLLQNVYDELYEKVLMRGDSATKDDANKFENFLGRLKRAISAEACPYTVILDDPLANSYIQNPYAPDPDPQLTSEWYERTYEQNEDFGLNDMVLEGYEAPKTGDAKPEAGADAHANVSANANAGTAAQPDGASPPKKPRTDEGGQ